MSRRSGQVGHIEKKGQFWTVRFRLDVPGRDERRNMRKVIAPVSGPGSLNKFELQRRAMEIVNEAGANSDVTLRLTEAVNLAPLFSKQAAQWLSSLSTRKRKPVKPATLASWESALKWINSRIGDMPLSSVDNVAVRDHVVTPGVDRGLAAKTVANYVSVIQLVVASVVDDRGEPVYDIKWNHDFMDLPSISNQRQPSFTGDEVTRIVANSEGQDAVLYALLAGSGLRIGEALGLRVEDVIGSVIHVRHSLWRGALQSPKTKNGVREVDLHSSLAVVVQALAAMRRSGFLFVSSSGGPMLRENIVRQSLHPVLKKIGREPCGFHAFRRFRDTHLRKSRVPDGLIQFWMGHAPESMTDLYDKVRDDAEFRRFASEQAGLGFIPPVTGRPVEPHEPRIVPSNDLKSMVLTASGD